jgi:hypothetical protein
MYGQKTRLGQELPRAKAGDVFPIKVHISGIHHRDEYIIAGQPTHVIYADAVISGKKVELTGDLFSVLRLVTVRLSGTTFEKQSSAR